MYQRVPSKWYFLMAMFIVHRKRYQAEEASRILDLLLSVYHLWCDWMSLVRERRCFEELKVACSPPGGDRRPGGWPLARPVAVAVSPHCWGWFIPYSRPPEQGGQTPPLPWSRLLLATRCSLALSYWNDCRGPSVSHMFGKPANWRDVAVARSVLWLATHWVTGIVFLAAAGFFASPSRLFSRFIGSVPRG